MEIRRATAQDHQRIMEIYRAAQDFMIQTGNPHQWGHFYPESSLIEKDIENGVCHVICEDDDVHGVFALMEGPDPTYRYIEGGNWLNDAPYLVIHRIAGDGQVHGLVTHAAEYAKGLSANVRVDTYHENVIMQRQISKNGFVKCGTIYLEDGSPRIAYHWAKK
jgi:hypothetical protein